MPLKGSSFQNPRGNKDRSSVVLVGARGTAPRLCSGAAQGHVLGTRSSRFVPMVLGLVAFCSLEGEFLENFLLQ